MNEETFEKLAIAYPDLFQKAKVGSFDIREGWFDLIDILCGLLSTKVEEARDKLHGARNNKKYEDKIPEYENQLEKALEELPIITQVKEKFGSLRFYTHGGTEVMDGYIRFAEQMSCRVCERCGAPGTFRNDGWIRVLCDKHHNEDIAYPGN
jgi:hypothetical protein